MAGTSYASAMLAAAWVGAGATVGLLIAAVITAAFALNAYRKQSREVELLQKQFDRDSAERRRAQAAQVFVWVSQDAPDKAFVMNSSKQPIYELVVSLPAGDECLKHLMPEANRGFTGVDTSASDGTFTVRCTFRDAAGVRWQTTALGILTEIVVPEAGRESAARRHRGDPLPRVLAGFEPAASSSRSQVAASAASPAACLSWEPSSVSVRLRPRLATGVVTHLVTRFRGGFCLTT